MALTFDLVPRVGSTWTQPAENVTEHNRRMLVSGFAATDYYSMIAELYSDGGFPAFGAVPDADPTFADLKLKSWDIVDVACTSGAPTIIINLVYSTQTTIFNSGADDNGPVLFRIRSVARDKEETQDKDGNLMQTVYDNKTQTKVVVRPKSIMIYECERLEATNTEDRANDILDHVNSLTWNGRPARTVLFSNFASTSFDNDATFQAVYTFAYNPLGWDELIYHELPNGKIPNDAPTTPSPGTALIQPEVIPETSFSPLNVSIPNP